MFKRYYRDRFREIFGAPPEPAEGLGDDAVRAALARRDLIIPRALFDDYAVAGRHWIDENHDHFRPSEDLEWMDDNLVFLGENQWVVYWGIPRADLKTADPIVWQGVNAEPMEWYPEKWRPIRFLLARWTWKMTGEEPELESS